LCSYVYAVEVTKYEDAPGSPQTALEGQTLLELKNDIRANTALINELPTEADVDTSFKQLDQKLSRELSVIPGQMASFVILLLILNDFLIFAAFIILMKRGLL